MIGLPDKQQTLGYALIGLVVLVTFYLQFIKRPPVPVYYI